MEEESYSTDLGVKKSLYIYILLFSKNTIQTRREEQVHVHCVLAVLVSSFHRTSVLDRQVPISQ